MKADELRSITIESAKKEIEKIEAEIVTAAKAGNLKHGVVGLSDAARHYFTENGFIVKLVVELGEPERLTKKWSISWEKKQKGDH